MAPPNYEDYIVSTSKYLRVIHRTSVLCVEGIMNNGLKFNELFLTATLQSKNMPEAKARFDESHKGNDAVIIIQVSVGLFEQIMKKLREEESGKVSWSDVFNDEKISYLRGSFFIRPEFILGYVDKRDNSIHFNPKFKEQ